MTRSTNVPEHRTCGLSRRLRRILPRAAAVASVVASGSFGCGGSSLVAPTPPVVPEVMQFEATDPDFSGVHAAGFDSWTYVPAADTQNPYTANGVTVQVTPILESNSSDPDVGQVLVTCNAPDRSTFETSSVGFALRISITNDTGHIVTTERSALQIGDGDNNGWDLIGGDWPQWVDLMQQAVEAQYALYGVVAREWMSAERARLASHAWFDEAYVREWETFNRDFQECYSSPAAMIARQRIFGDTSPCGQLSNVQRTSPTVRGSSAAAPVAAALDERFRTLLGQIDALEQRCVAAVREAALAPNLELVTEPRFERIRIFPGQTYTGYIPLEPDFARVGPDSLFLRLFDLVTDTDAAGNPTQRTNFVFELVKVPHSP